MRVDSEYSTGYDTTLQGQHAAQARRDALDMVRVVRDYGPDMVRALISRLERDPGRLAAAFVAAAAAVNPDSTPTQLWEWVDGPRPKLAPWRELPQLTRYAHPGLDPARQPFASVAEQVADLHGLPLRSCEIAARLGVSTRTVDRWRTELRRGRDLRRAS